MALNSENTRESLQINEPEDGKSRLALYDGHSTVRLTGGKAELQAGRTAADIQGRGLGAYTRTQQQ